MVTKQELLDEWRAFFQKSSVADAVVAPIVFVLLFKFAGLNWAVASAFAIAAVTLVWRLVRKQDLQYAVSGVIGVVIAGGLAWYLGSAEGYFIPGIVINYSYALFLALSLVVGKPLLIYVSQATRQWPAKWYLHKQVKPAYRDATVLWALYFPLEGSLQYYFYSAGQLELLATVRIFTGWPATILLLGATYVFGRWRLLKLAGPSVEEFEAGKEAPWEGQQKGF